jgi:hypothetical protein
VVDAFDLVAREMGLIPVEEPRSGADRADGARDGAHA